MSIRFLISLTCLNWVNDKNQNICQKYEFWCNSHLKRHILGQVIKEKPFAITYVTHCTFLSHSYMGMLGWGGGGKIGKYMKQKPKINYVGWKNMRVNNKTKKACGVRTLDESCF